MKNLNEKQKIWSQKKVEKSNMRLKLAFFLSLTFLFVIVVAGIAATHPDADWTTAFHLTGGGVSVAAMSVIGNVSGVGNKQTAPNQFGYRVRLIELSQVDPDQPFPQPNANREVGTIPLLPGENSHYFDAIDDTLKDNSTGEKGDITMDITNSLEFIMGGDANKLYDFIEEHAGGRFIVIYEKSSTGDRWIAGDDKKPMILQSFDRKRDTEATAVTFKFQNKSYKQPYKYVGSLLNTTPQVVAADATELVIAAGKDQYQLTNNTIATVLATVSGITAAMYGNYIEILGSGGAEPTTIDDSAVYILIDGTTWTANAGSRITFEILDDETLVEVPGTRVQT